MLKGLVTTTMKVQRHEAKKYYKGVIDQLYKEGMLKTDKKWIDSFIIIIKYLMSMKKSNEVSNDEDNNM